MAAKQRQRKLDQRDLNNLTGLRCALYCRVSKDDDKHGYEKSVTDQEETGRTWIESHGCVLAGVYADNDRSASRYARKVREDFERLLGDVEAGRLDILWFWELSRSQRRLDVYAKLRDLCRDRGILWVVSGRVYDLNNYMDLQSLNFAAGNSEVEVEMLSDRVWRGQEGTAVKGNPHGKLNYGYVRVYDERRRYVEQIPDDRPVEAVAPDGTVTIYKRAEIIKSIITRIADDVPIGTIRRDLDGRGIPTPRGAASWSRVTIRDLAKTVAYIGKRERNGTVLDHGAPCWKPLVSEEVFYRAQQVLTDEKRKNTRPNAARYLLSHIGKSAGCGEVLSVPYPGKYSCRECNCVVIPVDQLDAFAAKVIVGYLGREDVHEALMNAMSDRAEAVAARAEADRLRGQLEKWRQMAESGEADDPITLNRTIKGLTAKIAEEEGKAAEVGLPPILRGRTGPAAAQAWADADLRTRREIIRACADIRVKPVGRSRKGVPVASDERIMWRWLIGPDRAEGEPKLVPVISEEEHDRQALAKAREVFADRLAAGKLPGQDMIREVCRVGDRRSRYIQTELMRADPRLRQQGRRVITDEMLREVAEVYLSVPTGGLAAVAAHCGRSEGMAAKYVNEARGAGYLPPRRRATSSASPRIS